MFGGGGPEVPPPPPPPPNPPTYAAQSTALPNAGNNGPFAGLGQSILTTPFGAPDERATQRKSLLGQ